MATEGLSGERTPGVRGDWVCPLVAPLPFHGRSAARAAAAAQGVGGGPSPVRVSSPACAASAGGLAVLRSSVPMTAGDGFYGGQPVRRALISDPDDSGLS